MQKTTLILTLCLVVLLGQSLIAAGPSDYLATQPAQDLAFGPDSIPNTWNDTLRLTFRDDMGMPGNLRELTIDGLGNARVVRPSGGSKDKLVPWGEYEFPLSQYELAQLLRFLREQETWQLRTIHTRAPLPDEGGFTLEMSSAAAMLQVRFPSKLVEDMPRLSAIRERMRQLMSRVVGRSIDVPWGKAADGVQVRLRPVKRVWQAGQLPKFMLDVRNDGHSTIEFADMPGEYCQLEIDRQWHGWAGPLLISDRLRTWRLDQGESCEAAFRIELVDSWTKPAKATESDFKPGVKVPWTERLKLAPGRHLLHARFFPGPNKPPVVSNHCIIYVQPALSAELLGQRNRLLAQADAKIREGVIQLAERFPNLKKGRDWDRLSRPSQIGRIGISFRRSYRGKAATEESPFPEEEEFGVLVVIEEPRPELMQLATSPLYANLGLVGQVGSGAGDPQLDAALKALIAKALDQLKQLEAKAAGIQPATQLPKGP